MGDPTVAELVEALFAQHRHPSGRPYSNQEVADALHDAIDASYIAKLRRGAIKNPGRLALLALCRFFKVSPQYFFPELQPPYATDQRQADLHTALRATSLTPVVQRKLEELIAALQPDAPPADQGGQ